MRQPTTTVPLDQRWKYKGYTGTVNATTSNVITDTLVPGKTYEFSLNWYYLRTLYDSGNNTVLIGMYDDTINITPWDASGSFGHNHDNAESHYLYGGAPTVIYMMTTSNFHVDVYVGGGTDNFVVNPYVLIREIV